MRTEVKIIHHKRVPEFLWLWPKDAKYIINALLEELREGEILELWVNGKQLDYYGEKYD